MGVLHVFKIVQMVLNRAKHQTFIYPIINSVQFACDKVSLTNNQLKRLQEGSELSICSKLKFS